MAATDGARVARIRTLLVGNVAARVGALVALAVATVMVARAGGPDLGGRVHPAAGAARTRRCTGRARAARGGTVLPRVAQRRSGAAADAGGARRRWERRRDTRLARPHPGPAPLSSSPTGASGWCSSGRSPCFTQLPVAVGKSLLQGEQDLNGANRRSSRRRPSTCRSTESFSCSPDRGADHDGVRAGRRGRRRRRSGIAVRLRRRGFFRGWARPELRAGQEICGYGARGQLGGLLSLVNLRLDVGILGAIAGPAVLGVYAIASKYAELLRLPGPRGQLRAVPDLRRPRRAGRASPDEVAAAAHRSASRSWWRFRWPSLAARCCR